MSAMLCGVFSMKPSEVKYIVVHCSASPPSVYVDKAVIDRWHRTRGWLMIGYHYVIKRNGEVETGRRLDQAGAHVQNFNSKSIGICMVGGMSDEDGKTPEDNFTQEQYHSLTKLLLELTFTYFPGAEILGHRDFPNVHKACPSFDVKKWVAETIQPNEDTTNE